jgi:hypothetical protein
LLVYLALFYESFALQYISSLPTASYKFTAISPLTIMLFAFFVGFNWEWIFTIFKRIGEAITTRTTAEDYINSKHEEEGERASSKESKEQRKKNEIPKIFFYITM